MRWSEKNRDPDAWIVYLLILYDERTENAHYVFVRPKKLKALVSIGMSTGGTTSYNGNLSVCPRCLWTSNGTKAMDQHLKNGWCIQQPAVKTTLPELGKHFQYFKDYAKMLPCDFMIAADFECFLHKSAEEDGRVLHHHVPSQYGFVIWSTFMDYKKYYTYRVRETEFNYNPDAAYSVVAERFVGHYCLQNRTRKYADQA